MSGHFTAFRLRENGPVTERDSADLDSAIPRGTHLHVNLGLDQSHSHKSHPAVQYREPGFDSRHVPFFHFLRNQHLYGDFGSTQLLHRNIANVFCFFCPKKKPLLVFEKTRQKPGFSKRRKTRQNSKETQKKQGVQRSSENFFGANKI